MTNNDFEIPHFEWLALNLVKLDSCEQAQIHADMYMAVMQRPRCWRHRFNQVYSTYTARGVKHQDAESPAAGTGSTTFFPVAPR